MRRLFVNRAVEPDHAAECGDWIAFESLPVCFRQRLLFGTTRGIGVLDDGRRGTSELVYELPAGIQVDEIVVREFLTVQLFRACDSYATGSIKRSRLVRIFAVAQVQ